MIIKSKMSRSLTLCFFNQLNGFWGCRSFDPLCLNTSPDDRGLSREFW